MRLRSISLRGLTRFTDPEPLQVDFDALGPGLVAVVGANGAGKSTLLEAVPAALYRSLPSRPGSLYEHSHGRDAFVEALFDDAGRELKVRIQIDAEQRKTEGYIFEDGRSLTKGRVAEFEAEVTRRFGSRDLFLASVLAAQNKAGDFLRMSKRDRKALFVELLGLSYLEVLCGTARVHRNAADIGVTTTRALLEAIEEEVAPLPELEKRLIGVRAGEHQIALTVENARAEEAAAASTMERARSAAAQLEIHEKAIGAATRELEMAESTLRDAEALPGQIEQRCQQRLTALDAQDPDALAGRARERHTSALVALKARQNGLELIIARTSDVEAAEQQLDELVPEAAKLEVEAREITKLLAGEGIALEKLNQATQRYRGEMAHRKAEGDRLARQTELLGQVPCTTQAKALASTCPLLADARGARNDLQALEASKPDTKEADDARARLDGVHEQVAAAELASDPLRLEEIKGALPALRTTAAEAPVVERAKRELGSLDAERIHLDESRDRDLQEVGTIRERVAGERAKIEHDRQKANKEAHKKTKVAEMALRATHTRHEETKGAFEQAQALVVDLYLPTTEARHAEAVNTRVRAEHELRQADQDLAGLNVRICQLKEKVAAKDKHQSDLQHTEQEMGDWSLLERALGRDGVQALEIDAAGPGIAELTNELLAACYGSRFSISLETLREKRSARGEYSEAFDVQVYDGGLERPVEALSGGERVIVGEAMGLAISIFNSRRSGVRWETLFRDETAGALDPTNAIAYVDMLRRALALGSFRQVVFVSHQPEVWERADVRVLLEDGRVQLDAPEANTLLQMPPSPRDAGELTSGGEPKRRGNQ